MRWRKHFRERQQTSQFWAEVRDYHKEWLKEVGLLDRVERLAGHRPKGPEHGPGLIDPRGVYYSLHHRVPGSLAGNWTNEQINHAGNLLVVPGRVHSAFDNAIYSPVTDILKPGQKIWVPTAERESLPFYEKFNKSIRSLAEELRPLEDKTKNPAQELATGGLKARELPGVAKKNPTISKMREIALDAREKFNKLVSRTEEQFKSLTGEVWRHLRPEREGLLERAGALLRGVFGRGAAIESGIAAFREGEDAIGELQNGKFAEAGRDGLKAAGSAAYALTPAMAFFRMPAMMVLKRLPVVGAIAGFAEAGYDGYRALGCRIAGKQEESGFWATQALWRGAGAAGNLALSGMGPPGWVGAFGASWLAERQAANLEDSRRIRLMDKDQLLALYRNGGLSSPGEEGRRREQGEESSPGKDREIGQAPEPARNREAKETRGVGFFVQAPCNWVPRQAEAFPREEGPAVSASGNGRARNGAEGPQNSTASRVGPAFGLAHAANGAGEGREWSASKPAPVSPEEARERAIREMAASFQLNPGVRDDPELRKMREELCRFAYPILEEKRRKGALPSESREKPTSDPGRSSSDHRGYSFRQERPSISEGRER